MLKISVWKTNAVKWNFGRGCFCRRGQKSWHQKVDALCETKRDETLDAGIWGAEKFSFFPFENASSVQDNRVARPTRLNWIPKWQNPIKTHGRGIKFHFWFMKLFVNWSTVTPVVIMVFTHVVCTSVRPRSSKSRKTKQSEHNVLFSLWRNCGSGRVDHWWHLSFSL